MPQPPEVDRLADPLVRTIRDAWDEVLARQVQLGDDPRLARKRRWLAEMERSVASLMDEVDRQAAAWLRDAFPQTYGRGAVDLAVGEFTWTQPHLAAVRFLAGETWDDLLQATKFVRRRTKALVRELARAEVGSTLLAGQTARQGGANLARLLRERGVWAVTYRDGSRHGLGEYGEMVVRTRSAGAYNAGALNHGVASGVRFFEVFDGADCGWLRHDDPDRANGTVREAGDCAATPLSHPNAVMAGSLVAPLGELELGYRARWSGPVIEVRTAGGAFLTIGPNHPVLTGRGWIAADLLRQGDDVVGRPVERSVGTDRDNDQVPARVEHVFDSLARLGPDSRVVAAPDHLHGDGNFCEGEIEVVGAARHLAPVAYAALLQELSEAVLVGAGAKLPLEPGEGAGLAHVQRVRLPSPGFMGRGHVGRVGGPGSDHDASLLEALSEDAVANPDLCGQLLGAGAGEVSLDQVVEVRHVDSWSGHAYDLQTSTGTYWCDGILVHNCRRSFGARPDVGAAGARPTTTRSQREDARRFEEALDARSRARTARASVLARREARMARHAGLVRRRSA